jgi:hypothetical protein
MQSKIVVSLDHEIHPNTDDYGSPLENRPPTQEPAALDQEWFAPREVDLLHTGLLQKPQASLRLLFIVGHSKDDFLPHL